MNSKVNLCPTCVRNISSPYIESVEGQCIYCILHEKHQENLQKILTAEKGNFFADLDKRRGSGAYDCLMMMSGGKDSTMTLYKLVKRGGLRILAFTVDNGFEMPQALLNIKNATDLLEVDWMLDKPGYTRKVLRTFLIERIPISICHFCAGIMINRGLKAAHALGIPFMVNGWNKGQSDKEPSRHPLWNLEDDKWEYLAEKYPFMRGIGLGPNENEDFVRHYDLNIISPWIGEKRDNEYNMKFLRNELGWEETPLSYPRKSTSCRLNLLQVLLSRKNFGYSHYDAEESALVAFGEKTREEALRTVDYDLDENEIQSVLKELDLTLADIGLTEEDLHTYSRFFS